MFNLRDWLRELRRRHVFRVAGMYIVAAWVAVQVASLVFPAVDIPEAALRYVWAGFLLAFLPVVVFAWLYDITPDGITRTPPADRDATADLRLRPTDYVILVVLLAAISAMVFQLSSQIRDFESETNKMADLEELNMHTVAVLPLENVAGDESQQFLVDGMHDALISMLSRVSALRVISRTSARRFADSDMSLPEIGQELHAANIIEGSVARQGDSIRISVRLINAASEQLIWANIYDRQMEDVLRLQSELARTIAGEVKVLLTPEESAYLAATESVVPAAYENYLKGRFYWYRFGEKDLQLALEYFEKAIQLDPGYALAYVGLADALATPGHIGLIPSAEVFPRAEELSAQALELDPLLAEAHDFSARIRFVWKFDWLGADRGFREAIRLNANYPDARIVYSQFLAIHQRWEESMEQVRAGLQLDPLNKWFRIEVGDRLAWLGKYEDALEEFMQVANDDPNWFMIYRYLWEVHFYRGELERALEACKKFYELSGQTLFHEALSKFNDGTEYSAAMHVLASEMIAHSTKSHVSDFELARIFAFAGDRTGTLQWLERAAANRDTQLVYSAAQPIFSLVWNEPRYARLRQRMNLPE
jgi:TolB-like protein/lipoprotein NlpI